MRPLLISVFAFSVALATVASEALAQASFFELPGNRLVNPDAEQAPQPSGWAADGFGVASYGADRRVPARAYGDHRRLGARLFIAGREGASLRQVVSLADLADRIDAGEQELFFGGLIGGTGARQASVRLSLQPLGASGAPLGGPYTTGAPTARDREHVTDLLGCGVWIRALPAGARAAELTLTAVGPYDGAGSGLADRLYVTTTPVISLGRPAAARNCRIRPLDLAPVSLWRVIAKPAGPRDCSRPLRFAIRPPWVDRVTRLTITNRSRKRAIEPTARRRSITLRRSRRALRPVIRLRFTDGTELHKRIRYRGCRARVRR